MIEFRPVDPEPGDDFPMMRGGFFIPTRLGSGASPSCAPVIFPPWLTIPTMSGDPDRIVRFRSHHLPRQWGGMQPPALQTLRLRHPVHAYRHGSAGRAYLYQPARSLQS